MNILILRDTTPAITNAVIIKGQLNVRMKEI